MVPIPTPICHITHVSNLNLIINAGGLRAYSSLRRDGTQYSDIAYQNIQSRRATKLVPCGRGGTLHDYVPFYFAPRSPMLYTISRGNVPGCPDGQGPIVHLMSSVQNVQQAGLEFVFTDGHGIVDFTEYYDDVRHLERVDWPLMGARYWSDTNTDSDRCRRRQAEFLVHEFFPFGLVTEIGVMSRNVLANVEEALQGTHYKPELNVRRDWYY
jgi:hypothetical protein